MYRINEKAVAWLPPEEIEPKALDQIRLISAMPFIHWHIAVMPDCHLGLGATVGSVIPTVGAIIPAAVGVDIGCGMIAVRTALARADLPADLAPLRESIERRIPLSVGGRNRSLYATAVDKVRELADRAGPRRKLYDSIAPHWQLQLGSLGSGNHFVEVVEDQERRRLGVPAFRLPGRGQPDCDPSHPRSTAALQEQESRFASRRSGVSGGRYAGVR